MSDSMVWRWVGTAVSGQFLVHLLIPPTAHISASLIFISFCTWKLYLLITKSAMTMKPNNLRYYLRFHHGFDIGTLNMVCRYDKCLNKKINCDETKSKACISINNQWFCCITFCIFSTANRTYYLYTIINKIKDNCLI